MDHSEDDKRFCVYVHKKQRSKCFNPKTLFPDLLFDEAKRKSFDLAVNFRDSIFKENAA